jgi:glutamine synthetase
MSATFKHYLAGQLKLMPDLLLMYAPNVNSYKRLVEGFWAPTTATWGVDNRTTAVRVIKGSPSSTRMETRVCGSDINPYLAIAAALASGLWGIETKAELDIKPVQGDAYKENKALKLARNLSEAVQRFEESPFARELFGENFVTHFANSRRWEWRQFQQSVTTYERERYFEII